MGKEEVADSKVSADACGRGLILVDGNELGFLLSIDLRRLVLIFPLPPNQKSFLANFFARINTKTDFPSLV